MVVAHTEVALSLSVVGAAEWPMVNSAAEDMVSLLWA